MEPCKSLDPPYRGVPEYFFHKVLFQIFVSNLFNVLEVGRKIKSKFSNLSPLPNLSNAPHVYFPKSSVSHFILDGRTSFNLY